MSTWQVNALVEKIEAMTDRIMRVPVLGLEFGIRFGAGKPEVMQRIASEYCRGRWEFEVLECMDGRVFPVMTRQIGGARLWAAGRDGDA
jgi:hypothetical protein